VSVLHAPDGEQQLQTGVEPLPVGLYRRPAREAELHARRQTAEGAAGEALQALGACDVGVAHQTSVVKLVVKLVVKFIIKFITKLVVGFVIKYVTKLVVNAGRW
jgi:hypothetical protein